MTQQVAAATVNAPVVAALTNTLTPLFSGLTLGPSAYHLVLFGDANAPAGRPECWSTVGTTSAGSGVTFIGDSFVDGSQKPARQGRGVPSRQPS